MPPSPLPQISPLLTPICQARTCSHSLVTLMSSCCVSETFSRANAAASSCFCVSASQASLHRLWRLEPRHARTKLSSTAAKRLARLTKPFSSVGSSLSKTAGSCTLGVSRVCFRLCTAYARSVMNSSQYSLRRHCASTGSSLLYDDSSSMLRFSEKVMLSCR